MPLPQVLTPVQGCRVVKDDNGCVLIGQPPEVLKGLLNHGITAFDTLVLTDTREFHGSLLNNLEFPLYFFLFFARGFEQGRKLRLVGTDLAISHALKLLRITLMGPTRHELDLWGTEPAQKEEWLAVCDAIALKDSDGKTVPIEAFFELCPFRDGIAETPNFRIEHSGCDSFSLTSDNGSVAVSLADDGMVNPSYTVQSDYVPGGLVKLGVEILGGASGFTPDEPCTGLALCYNGDYMLIDAIPFLDQHLFARGISKNQVSACFLTHVHDDHCAMFPLMLMPHRVDVITTREIFHMAMDKLACSLGWQSETVAEHFSLIEIVPGEPINYFGMTILPHLTVHSVPTVGATFSCVHQGYERRVCLVGDNHSMTVSRQMAQQGIVRNETVARLDEIYRDNYNLLIADGGAGEIHGDPEDAIQSEADRVLFVHVDHLPSNFNTTFSLARSGKRYTVIEGDSSLYTSQVNHYLTEWLGEPFPNRWMRSLLAEEEIRKYNQDDVLIVQGAETKGYVYLILTGYCEVVQHDGERFQTIARLQAGDIIGEMAVVTGLGTRNASIVATTPVTVCVFAEDTFGSFIHAEGFRAKLINRWALRPVLKNLPQFSELKSTAIEKLCHVAELVTLNAGEEYYCDESAWFIDAGPSMSETSIDTGREYGWCPLAAAQPKMLRPEADVRLVRFERETFGRTLHQVPQVNYYLHKLRGQEDKAVSWLLPEVSAN